MQETTDDLIRTQISISRRMQHLSEPPDKISEVDDGAGTVTTYVGYAGVGTLTTADATWLIIKLVEDSTVALTVNTDKQYANACLKKNQVWNDRTTLTYGYLQKS